MKKYRIRTVTTILGERDVEAPSQREAIAEVRADIIKAGFSSPFGNPIVRHEIYVKDELE